jgi:thiol-disulfide isomerase/thioredoxin
MRHALIVPLLAFAAATASLTAQDPAKQDPTKQDPAKPVAADTAAPAKPNASELLGKALRFTQSLPAMHLKATAQMVLPELPEEIAAQIEGQELPSFEVEMIVAMPNRFVFRAGEAGMGDVVCDGKQLLQSNERFELYSLTDAPKDVHSFLGSKRGMFGLPGETNLRQLLAPAGSKKALLDAKTVELVGDGKVGGKDAWQLAIKDEGLACELWVMKGDEPWVLRHKPAPQKLDMEALMNGGGEAEEGEDEDGPKGLSIEPGFELEFASCSKEVQKDAFAVEPPKGATKVDDLQKAVMERFQEEMGDMMEEAGEDADDGEDGEHGGGKPHASVGKPAPDVEFAMLDGSKQKLADLKGKVVVLDFWATWCGPCVKGLPKVSEVTKKLADQGVVFVACNLAEDKETVEKFLTNKQLSIAVALCDQALGGKFGVSGIPHTVVIGADGVVKKVHVGFGPGGEKQLEKDILEVLGKPAEKKEPPKEEKPAEEKKADAGGK